ncbi:uncharacterized protein LOC121235350 [Juglans microcarpa x Juglans regia]|uniref:uncharacterized protein LOC121235350 n=1 Tax=Juglans microcarpa x Juglans regia TaxID=2249226 RepID=UPI001B7DB1CB|nr:uncharacterized protein LOC121235350 [Juglans microcarpa x Juglans regia]
MESDLSVLCEGLKLTEEEQQEVEVSNEDVISSESKSKHCFMLCVASDKEVNRGAFRSTMALVWQVEGKVVFKEVGRNKFLVELKERDDKKRIMQGRPWSFNKNLICIQDCEGFESWKVMKLQYEPFWVQCHDLPFAGMNANTSLNLGKAVGEVLKVDTDSSGVCWESFLRIKVMIDLTKPLARGRFLNLGNSKYWIPFKYEKLPNFCYHCGKIKHAHGMCDKLDRGNASLEDFSQQYGASLETLSKYNRISITQRSESMKRY